MRLSCVASLAVVSLGLAAAPAWPQQPARPGTSAPAAPGTATSTGKGAAKGTGGEIEHGRYLVESVAMCIECHSPRDERGVIVAGQEYTGAAIPFRPPWPNDWADRAPRNRGLPGYSRELAMRLLMAGSIDREDRQLRPPMPRFRMTPQDAAAVYAYLSSLR